MIASAMDDVEQNVLEKMKEPWFLERVDRGWCVSGGS